MIDVPAPDGASLGLQPAVYVHDAKRLFKLDPNTLSFSVVGDFDCVTISDASQLNDETSSCCIGMTDIAISRSGRMLGMLRDLGDPSYRLVEIDRQTARCTTVGTVGKMKIKGLTFLPTGAVDPNTETLVGVDLGCDYWRIDVQTAQASKLGVIPGCSAKGADLVSIEGSETFLVAGGALKAIDPKTGQILRTIGTLTPPPGAYPNAGLGYWAGKLYGFTLGGSVIAIDDKTAAVSKVPLQGALPAQFSFQPMFSGAGVTTIAPTIK